MLPSINELPFPQDKQNNFNQIDCLDLNSNKNIGQEENSNLTDKSHNVQNQNINYISNNQLNDNILLNNLKTINLLQNEIQNIQNQINKIKKAILNNNNNKIAYKEQIGHIKGFWSHDEDELLIKAVKETNPCVWEIVASKVPGRSPIQCKERWLYRLHPGVNKARFEKWEDDIIINERNRIGNSWTYISTKLNGRTPLAVKNRWYLFLKKKLKS